MVLWNKILSGFDNEDETVNFGARTVFENNGSLYETYTIATIGSEEKTEIGPSVTALLEFSKLCIAIDESLTIFSHESCAEVLINVCLDSIVTNLQINKNANYLFIATVNGTLICLHIPSGGKCVFSLKIIQNNTSQVKIVSTFLKEKNEIIDIFLITNTGVVYRVPEFKAKSIDLAINNNDELKVIELTQNIKYCTYFEGFSSGEEVKCAAVCEMLEEFNLIIVSTKTILSWPSQTSRNIESLPDSFTKMQSFKNYNSMICLNSDQILHILCPFTLISRMIYKEPIVDFQVIQDENDYAELQIVMLIKNDDDMSWTIRSTSFPGFENKFQINMANMVYLISLSNLYHDNVIFLECINKFTEKQSYFQVKAVTESAPEHRLLKLLRRKKFVEAETFAKTHNLSLESIYRSKTQMLMERLDSCDTEDETFMELCNILENIKDDEYVITCCMNAWTPNYNHMKTLYQYARHRLMKCSQNVDENEHQVECIIVINNRFKRIVTHELITKHYEQDWGKFARANLLEEVQSHLDKNEFEVAALIWTRHIPEMNQIITIQISKNIFNGLKESASPTDLWLWLSHFISSAITLYPEIISFIILWIYQRTKSLEQYFYTSWPDNGIDFIDEFLNLLELEKTRLPFNFSQQYTNRNFPLQHLISLSQDLIDLKTLQLNYGIKLTLALYTQDPISVVNSMLNRISLERSTDFVNIFLRQYALKHSLERDYLLVSYIQSGLKQNTQYYFWEDVHRENKVIALIDFIENIQERLEVTLDLLKNVPVPWDSTIVELSEKSITFDHPLSDKIKMEINKYTAVKLILKKYNYEKIGFTNKLPHYIIKQNDDKMFEDLKVLIENNLIEYKQTFYLCALNFINKGDIEKAIEIFNSVDNDVSMYFFERLTYYMMGVLNMRKVPNYIKHHIEILHWIEYKLKDLAIISKNQTLLHRSNSIISRLKNIECVYLLKQEGIADVNFDNFHLKKNEILQNYISSLRDEIQNSDDSLKSIIKKINKIANLLGLEDVNATFLLMKTIKDVNILKSPVLWDLENWAYPSKCSFINDTCGTALQTFDLDMTTLNAMKKLCQYSLKECSAGELERAILMKKWVYLYEEVFSELEIGKEINKDTKYKLYPIYKDIPTSPDSIIALFKNSLSFMMRNQKRIKLINSTDEISMEENESKNEPERFLIDLQSISQDMHIQNNDYYFFQVIKTLYYGHVISDQTKTNEIKSLLSNSTRSILEKLLNCRHFDLFLGLSCLFLLPQEKACQWISTCIKLFPNEHKRQYNITTLGFEYFSLLNDKTSIQKFKDKKILHYWAQKLTNFSISYNETLNSTVEDKVRIIEKVMHSNMDNIIEILYKFCTSFGFNTDDCLIMYLQILLNNWKPTLKKVIIDGTEGIRISHEEVEELKTNCNSLINKIHNKADLKKRLFSLREKINIYHYEVFIILMDLNGETDNRYRSYLYFLQNYTRIGPPTLIEQDEWNKLQGHFTPLPVMAKWRLPHLTSSEYRWKIIAPELNLKTYTKWLKISQIFKLSSHTICTLAIKGEIDRISKNNASQVETDQWSCRLRDSSLLPKIQKCITHMGSDAAYYGTAALYYVVNHTPPGADQVAAVQACYEHVQLALREKIKFEEGLVEKIRIKYFRYTSEHILRSHNLGQNRYLDLIQNPSKLVQELFMDESIVLRYRVGTNNKPDINSAVDALGTLFSNVNLVKIKLDLLEKWLHSDTTNMEFVRQESFTDTIRAEFSNLNSFVINDDNIFRACYMLQHGDMLESANFLINIIFNDNEEDSSHPGVRYRALYILQSITDVNTLKNLTKRDSQTIKKYMISLEYIFKLRNLGLIYTINSFETCSKYKLVQILWQTKNHSPYALDLILKLCIDFSIYDHQFWNQCLIRTVELSMISELTIILPKIQHINQIIVSKGYTLACKMIITETFKRLDINPTVEQINDCTNTLCFLNSCNIPDELDLMTIADYCFQSKQYHFAAVLLPFLNNNDQHRVFKVITDASDLSKTIANLEKLKGILTISHSLTVLRKLSLQ